jgi:hypothetical protein
MEIYFTYFCETPGSSPSAQHHSKQYRYVPTQNSMQLICPRTRNRICYHQVRNKTTESAKCKKHNKARFVCAYFTLVSDSHYLSTVMVNEEDTQENL